MQVEELEMELFSAKNELAKVGGHLNLGEEAIISVVFPR